MSTTKLMIIFGLSICTLDSSARTQTNPKEFAIVLNENTPALNSQISYHYDCLSHKLLFTYSTDPQRAARLDSLTIDDISLRESESGQVMNRVIVFLKTPYVVGVTCSSEGFTIGMSSQAAFDPKLVKENHVVIHLPLPKR